MQCPKCKEDLRCDDFWVENITDPLNIKVSVLCPECNWTGWAYINFNNFFDENKVAKLRGVKQ